MSIPNQRVTDFQQEEKRRGLGAAIGQTWLKSPLYSMQMNYLHRPGVWSSMGGGKGWRHHGLAGFATLGAGRQGIGWYHGNPKTGEASPFNLANYANRYVGRGIAAGGRAIHGYSYGREISRAMAASGYNASNMAQYSANALSSTWSRFGAGMERVGAGLEKGGWGGAISGIGGTRATSIGAGIQKFFGGGWYDQIGGYGALDLDFDAKTILNIRGQMNNVPIDLDRVEKKLVSGINKNVRVRDLFHFGDKGMNRILGDVIGKDYITAKAIERQTGNIGRAVRFKAATRLMSGAAVGINIAMIGGILAAGAYRGITATTDAAMKFMNSNSMRRLETGSGLNPFPFSGAVTERAKALQAISNSRMNARGTLGGEAALAHENI